MNISDQKVIELIDRIAPSRAGEPIQVSEMEAVRTWVHEVMVELGALPICEVIPGEGNPLYAVVKWTMNPLPVGTQLFQVPPYLYLMAVIKQAHIEVSAGLCYFGRDAKHKQLQAAERTLKTILTMGGEHG